jgi:CheY-like chemotaxis protein
MTDERRKEGTENVTSRKDIEAFTKDTSKSDQERPELTKSERNDKLLPQPLVKIVNYSTGDVTQASLAELNQQMRDFDKVSLLIEDDPAASDKCTRALHDLGYNGVQLITHLTEAEYHLDDIISKLTRPPAAIVLDLGLGLDSGFTLLRKCHAEPRLQRVPILVWTKHTDDLSKTFSEYLGAEDFLIKSDDEQELRQALTRLLDPKEATPSSA